MSKDLVLFLDFDGVINTMSDIFRDGADAINPKLVANLNSVVDATGCKVVVSSDWRKFHTLSELQDFLDDAGFRHKLDSVTDDNRLFLDDPDNDDFPCAILPRGDVIRRWVTVNGCDNFVIVDDNLVGGDMDKFLIQTDVDDGLTKDIAKQLIARLNQ